MKSIAIYVEGGGDSSDQRAELRLGFDNLLRSQKDRARARRMLWKLIPSGGRDETARAFLNAVGLVRQRELIVLLVDAEDSQAGLILGAAQRKAHLERRDRWDLKLALPEHIHLMVQCMEAWIVADPDALASYYQKGFRKKALPARVNLEEESKGDIYSKLESATKETSKGPYAKIRHASKLLQMIDAKKVAARCPHFGIFVSWLDEQIAAPDQK